MYALSQDGTSTLDDILWTFNGSEKSLKVQTAPGAEFVNDFVEVVSTQEKLAGEQLARDGGKVISKFNDRARVHVVDLRTSQPEDDRRAPRAIEFQRRFIISYFFHTEFVLNRWE